MGEERGGDGRFEAVFQRRRWGVMGMSRMAALIIVGVAAAGANAAPTPSACHAGAYRFDDGQLMVIGAPVETTLRYG